MEPHSKSYVNTERHMVTVNSVEVSEMNEELEYDEIVQNVMFAGN